ncbi:FXYD domain-containing ion transport regulator 11 isoform X2 [Amphiprion ocellaris]|uniref:FXYD domain-containing ion transport regulator n=1 Tax=Amphiprion percula TaxID=161767 RepID=A0A3P8TRE2_AMPPE|nr:FXYD domain-containing ion transport regulator 11 isoform X2 [Amphiprion ocellaris]
MIRCLLSKHPECIPADETLTSRTTRTFFLRRGRTLTMGNLTLVALIAVLFSFFTETEANPFVYNYERLRIGGLICACLLVAGGVSVILYNRCSRKNKAEDDNSEI